MEAVELMERLVSRRELLAAFLGTSLASGCGRRAPRLPSAGSIVGAADEFGHRLRRSNHELPADDSWKEIGVAIVGGGVAGLSAAWRLKRSGIDDFVVLELEASAG